MKFQEGKFLAKLRSPDNIDEKEFFLKITFDAGKHYVYVDDAGKKEIDESVRDWLLNDVHLIRPLHETHRPEFRKVEFVVRAESEFGTHHEWTTTSWERLEQILKKFPGLLKAYVNDSKRRSWLLEFVRNARELRNQNIFGKKASK